MPGSDGRRVYVVRTKPRSYELRLHHDMAIARRDLDPGLGAVVYPWTTILPDAYWTLGLPSKPVPGSCWEVRWKRLRFQIDASTPMELLKLDGMLVPIARDITEELRAKS